MRIRRLLTLAAVPAVAVAVPIAAPTAAFATLQTPTAVTSSYDWDGGHEEGDDDILGDLLDDLFGSDDEGEEDSDGLLDDLFGDDENDGSDDEDNSISILG